MRNVFVLIEINTKVVAVGGGNDLSAMVGLRRQKVVAAPAPPNAEGVKLVFQTLRLLERVQDPRVGVY